MKKLDKLVENIMKIIKVSGFHITFPGDVSMDADDTEWKLEGDFHFDNENELEEFKAHLNLTFRSYTGEDCLIETFEERQLQIDTELENQ
jgi:hypothetical protein